MECTSLNTLIAKSPGAAGGAFNFSCRSLQNARLSGLMHFSFSLNRLHFFHSSLATEGSKYAVSNSQRINKSVDKNEDGWLLRNSTHGWYLSTSMHMYLREHTLLFLKPSPITTFRSLPIQLRDFLSLFSFPVVSNLYVIQRV